MNIDLQVIGLAPDQPQYRILVVDDIWENRQLLVRLLEPLGFVMREAENGEEAVEIAQAFRPHLIYMDIYMPIMDGIEATQQIRATAWGRSIRIVALTASVGKQDSDKVKSAGCDAFLPKPLNIQDMFNVLTQQLNVRFMMDQQTSPNDSVQPELPKGVILTALISLPDDLIQRLREFTELGDITGLDEIIQRIAEHHQQLAGVLADMVERFDFDELLAHLEEAQAQ